MYTVTNDTITLTRGDSVPINFELLDSEGAKVNLAETDKLLFTVRKYRKKDPNDVVYTFQKEIVNGSFKIEPQDTYNLTYGKYVWDIEYVYSDGKDSLTVLNGELYLTDEVT